METKGLTRRNFMTGALAAAGAVGAMGLAGCSPSSQSATTTQAATTDTSNTSLHTWETAPKPITDFADELEADVVIIGAGMAGCTAAQAAAEAGASVIVVEQFSGITAHGEDIGGIGTKLQAENGIEVDKDEAARLIYQWSQQLANWNLIRVFTERSGEVLDYYIDMARDQGIEINLDNRMTARSDWDDLEERFRQFRTAHKFGPLQESQREDGQWQSATFIDMCKDDAEANGATFMFDTKAEQLIKDGDAVTGVVVSDGDGYKKIVANNGVIIATGGIGNNQEMIECWCPLALRADTNSYTPEGGESGDGILMGMWAGAAPGKSTPAPMVHPVNLAPMGPGFDTTWLTVDRNGQRYCCEMGYEPIVTNARMNTPGNVAFAIMDADYKEHAIKQEPVKSDSFVDGLEEAVEAAVKEGTYYKGETLDDLAKEISVPAGALKASIDRYNQWCDTGVDKDFGVPERFLSPIKNGPFYACKVNAWLLALPYGLHVDQNSQVCTADDKPIEGLFAIGNAQGDFFGNSYPVTCPGTSHGRCVTFGRLAGQALAIGTTIEGYNIAHD